MYCLIVQTKRKDQSCWGLWRFIEFVLLSLVSALCRVHDTWPKRVFWREPHRDRSLDAPVHTSLCADCTNEQTIFWLSPVERVCQCDLVRRHFITLAKSFNRLWQFFERNISFWQNVEPTLVKNYAFGQIFTAANCQMLKI